MSGRQALIDITEAAYAAFSRGDLPALIALCDPACTWEAPGFVALMPWARRHEGHAGVTEFVGELHAHLEFQAFAPHGFVVDETAGQVVALGTARCRVLASDRVYRNPWAHLFTLRDGLITGFREYPDTAAQLAAIHPALLADPRLNQEL